MFEELVKEISKKGNKNKALNSKRFFKTGKGQYGEGDEFIGMTVPEMRSVSKKFKDLPILDIKKLIQSKIHEHRFITLTILDLQYQESDLKNKKKIAEFYLKNKKYVNNWDLVDTSACYILGDYLYKNDRSVLYKLARSKSLFDRRIAIIATHYFIKKGDFKDTLKIGELLLADKEDLIHKAVGWTLREVGKKDKKVLERFLNKNIKKIPRTALRYAIERFDAKKRKEYLNK